MRLLVWRRDVFISNWKSFYYFLAFREFPDSPLAFFADDFVSKYRAALSCYGRHVFFQHYAVQEIHGCYLLHGSLRVLHPKSFRKLKPYQPPPVYVKSLSQEQLCRVSFVVIGEHSDVNVIRSCSIQLRAQISKVLENYWYALRHCFAAEVGAAVFYILPHRQEGFRSLVVVEGVHMALVMAHPHFHVASFICNGFDVEHRAVRICGEVVCNVPVFVEV